MTMRRAVLLTALIAMLLLLLGGVGLGAVDPGAVTTSDVDRAAVETVRARGCAPPTPEGDATPIPSICLYSTPEPAD